LDLLVSIEALGLQVFQQAQKKKESGCDLGLKI
jgi:hypothetical protein